MRRSLRPIAAFALLAGASAAFAGENDRSRASANGGAVISLDAALAAARDAIAGDVVGIELEREDGVWVYEVEIVTPGGVMVEAYVDARTGQVISQHERRGKKWK